MNIFFGLLSIFVFISGALGNNLVFSPLMNTTLCDPTDPPSACSMKLSSCSKVDKFLTDQQVTQTQTNCATLLVNDPKMAALGIKISGPGLKALANDDPSTVTSLNYCSLGAMGLLNLDMTINRMALATKIAYDQDQDDKTLKTTQAMVAAGIQSGIGSCPEPDNYDITSFLGCVKQSCMTSLTPPPAPAMPFGMGSFGPPGGMGSFGPPGGMGAFGAPGGAGSFGAPGGAGSFGAPGGAGSFGAPPGASAMLGMVPEF